MSLLNNLMLFETSFKPQISVLLLACLVDKD